MVNMNIFDKTLPPFPTIEEGVIRAIGVEFEYGGVGFARTAELIVEEFGGWIEQVSIYIYHIKETRLGDFMVEIDSGVFKDKRYQYALSSVGFDLVWVHSKPVEEWLMDVFLMVVFFEVIIFLIPFFEIALFDLLRERLCLNGALGTKVLLLYGFGFHLNVDSFFWNVFYVLRYL